MNEPKKLRVLCVFSRVLGGNTFSTLLDEFLASKNYLQCEHIDFFETDYEIKINWLFEALSSGVAVSAKMKRKLTASAVEPEAYDLLFFQSHRVCVPFLKYIKNIPTIVALDATPRSAHQGNIQAYSWPAKVKAAAALLLDIFWYAPIFKQVDFFLARTEIVKTSLIRDYGVAENKIAVTYSPLAIADSPGMGPSPDKLHILFVGNDFARKGGPFLLEVFSKYLKSCATLTIVSKDPSLRSQSWPPGVKLIPGLPRPEVLKLYSQCDIFVMPTWKDEGGIAICEAVSAGLPVVVRDTASQHEMVDHEVTGYLMPYQSTVQEWGKVILKLAENINLRKTFANSSLKKAKNMFDQTTFIAKLDLALGTALKSSVQFKGRSD